MMVAGRVEAEELLVYVGFVVDWRTVVGRLQV